MFREHTSRLRTRAEVNMIINKHDNNDTRNIIVIIIIRNNNNNKCDECGPILSAAGGECDPRGRDSWRLQAPIHAIINKHDNNNNNTRNRIVIIVINVRSADPLLRLLGVSAIHAVATAGGSMPTYAQSWCQLTNFSSFGSFTKMSVDQQSKSLEPSAAST